MNVQYDFDAMHEIDNPLRKGEFVLIFSNAMLEDIFVDCMLTFFYYFLTLNVVNGFEGSLLTVFMFCYDFNCALRKGKFMS